LLLGTVSEGFLASLGMTALEHFFAIRIGKWRTH
jgi:hypothetical protein